MNPFFTDHFRSTWLNYFRRGAKVFKFDFLEPVHFLKNKFGLYYFNVGKNVTNGIFYNLTSNLADSAGKVFLVYDILPYLQEENENQSHLRLKKVGQYQGYLTDIRSFESFDDYFSNQFSSKSRNNIRKWDKRLNKVFQIDFKVFYGDIAKEEFNQIFDNLIELIEKRWEQLGMDNEILTNQDYYRTLSYQMILDKTASLNVIYANGKPISISICFVSEQELFFAITTFDTDFRKYNLGHLLIMYILKWCFANNFKIFDYSKGKYEYKTRWANKSYVFENHILFDRRSLSANIIGESLIAIFSLKQFLRKNRINVLYSKVKFWFNKKDTNPKVGIGEITIKDLKGEEEINDNKTLIENLWNPKYNVLRPIVFDILFSHPQELEDLEIFKVRNQGKFILIGQNLNKEIEIANFQE